MRIFHLKVASAVFFLFYLISFVLAEPKFREYQVGIYEGPIHPLVAKSEREIKYRAVLSAGYPAKVNFSGGYVFISWPTDNGCKLAAAINAETGVASFLPVSVCSQHNGSTLKFSFENSSRLLVATGTIDREGTHFFELTDDGFVRLAVPNSQLELREQRVAILSKIFDEEKEVESENEPDSGFGWRSADNPICIPSPHDLKSYVEKWEIIDGEVQGCRVVDRESGSKRYTVQLSCGDENIPAKIVWEKVSSSEMSRFYGSAKLGSYKERYLRCDVPPVEQSVADISMTDIDCDIVRQIIKIDDLSESFAHLIRDISSVMEKADRRLAERLRSLGIETQTESRNWEVDKPAQSLEETTQNRSVNLLKIGQEVNQIIDAAIRRNPPETVAAELNEYSSLLQSKLELFEVEKDVLSDSWKGRALEVADWFSDGVQFEDKFYGKKSVCEAPENVFNGTWKWGTQPLFSIEGQTFKFLTTKQIKKGHDCVPHYSDFTYASKANAWVEYQLLCPDGSDGVRGRLQFVFVNGEVKYAECMGVEDGVGPENCMSFDAVQYGGAPIQRD